MLKCIESYSVASYMYIKANWILNAQNTFQTLNQVFVVRFIDVILPLPLSFSLPPSLPPSLPLFLSPSLSPSWMAWLQGVVWRGPAVGWLCLHHSSWTAEEVWNLGLLLPSCQGLWSRSQGWRISRSGEWVGCYYMSTYISLSLTLTLSLSHSLLLSLSLSLTLTLSLPLLSLLKRWWNVFVPTSFWINRSLEFWTSISPAVTCLPNQLGSSNLQYIDLVPIIIMSPLYYFSKWLW